MAASSLLYTFTLGMLAAVNPCGFPLLPAYLEFFVGPAGTDDGIPTRALRAVTAAAFATVGFVALFGTLGLITQFGWSTLANHSSSVSRYLAAAMGVGMVVLGVLTLARRPLKVRLPEVGTGTGLRRPAALAVFGFSYGVASISCSLPLFVAGVAASFGHGTSLHATGGLLAYAVGMGTVLGALALGIAVLGRGAGRNLRKASRLVPVTGGVLLVAVGAYQVWYWLTDILAPNHSFALQRVVDQIQTDISNPLDAHAQLVGALLGALVILAIVTGGLLRPGRIRAAAGGRAQTSAPLH